MQCRKWCCCLVFTSISCHTEPAFLCMLHYVRWCSLASGCLHCSWGCCKLRRGFGFHKLVISSAMGVHHLEISYRKCLWTRPLRDSKFYISPQIRKYKQGQLRIVTNIRLCTINIIQASCVARTLPSKTFTEFTRLVRVLCPSSDDMKRMNWSIENVSCLFLL